MLGFHFSIHYTDCTHLIEPKLFWPFAGLHFWSDSVKKHIWFSIIQAYKQTHTHTVVLVAPLWGHLVVRAYKLLDENETLTPDVLVRMVIMTITMLLSLLLLLSLSLSLLSLSSLPDYQCHLLQALSTGPAFCFGTLSLSKIHFWSWCTVVVGLIVSF